MSNARILIVEDESISALFLHTLLEDTGYRVVGIIESGEEAMVMANQVKPDLILMDIMLKGEMDGIEAANRIYALYGIPTIFMTAYSLVEFNKMQRFTENTMPIQKPIQEEELLNRIQNVLKLKKPE